MIILTDLLTGIYLCHYRAEKNDAFIEKSIQLLCVSSSSSHSLFRIVITIIIVVVIIFVLYNNSKQSLHDNNYQ